MTDKTVTKEPAVFDIITKTRNSITYTVELDDYQVSLAVAEWVNRNCRDTSIPEFAPGDVDFNVTIGKYLSGATVTAVTES